MRNHKLVTWSAIVLTAAVMGLAPPALAKSGGGGGGGGGGAAAAGHASTGHVATARSSDGSNGGSGCDVIDCGGGGTGHVGLGNHTFSSRALTAPHNGTTGTRNFAANANRNRMAANPVCNDVTCRGGHHRHHHHGYGYGDNYALFGSNGPYVYEEPQPTCWHWNYRLHRRVWACGPNDNG
jgi:hypothetical protein